MKRLKRILRQLSRRLSGPSPKTERNLGDESRSAGDWAMAARHYRAHVTRHPADFDIWVQLGHAYKEAGRFDDAEIAYEAAQRLKPEDADLLLGRGHLAKLKGDLDLAADFYNRSFAIDADPRAARELGQISLPRDEVVGTGIVRASGAIDGFGDGLIGGWAVDPGQSDTAVQVEIIVNGSVIATGVCDIDRPDLIAAGLARHAAGFLIDLSGLLDLTKPTALHARVAGRQTLLAGSPMIAEVSEHARDWSNRWKTFPRGGKANLVARIKDETPDIDLSIIVPLAADADRLEDLIVSLERQLCDRWEAILIPTSDRVVKFSKSLTSRLAKDPRFRVLQPCEPNRPAAVMDALKQLSSDHVIFLAADSVLEPEAVWRILSAISQGADFVLWDEARIGPSPDSVERFVFRSSVSIDHCRAFPSLVGSLALHRETALASLEECGVSAGIQTDAFRLACLERSSIAAHIPSVLERRSLISPGERQPARGLTKRGVRSPQPSDARTLVVLTPALHPATLRTTVEALLISTDRDSVDLLIVVRTKLTLAVRRYLDRLAGVAQVWLCDDEWRPGQSVNEAIAAHGRQHGNLVLIDAPMTPSGAWLADLVSHLSRHEVGGVGPILVSSDRKVVSAGVAVTADGLINSHRGVPLVTRRGRSLGWNRSLVSLREQSAAYGCLALRHETYAEAGGLDPIMSDHTVIVDLCLRLGLTGRRTLIDPRTPIRIGPVQLVTTLDEPFRGRWAGQIAQGDPFLNPSLHSDLSIATMDTLFSPAKLRAINPPTRPVSASRLGLLPTPSSAASVR